MKLILSLMLLISFSVHAGLFSTTTKIDEKDLVRKCLFKEKPSHEVFFYKDELCKYGANGCVGVDNENRFIVVCSLSKVSHCFEQKAWENLNQFFELNQNVKLYNSEYYLQQIDGEVVTRSCVIHNKT